MIFKDTSNMMPSDMIAYIGSLESEIQGQREELRTLRKPDHFVLDGTSVFTDEASVIASLDVCDVREAKTYRAIDKSVFIVKINEHRIDKYSDRIKAEGVAMLHDHS